MFRLLLGFLICGLSSCSALADCDDSDRLDTQEQFEEKLTPLIASIRTAKAVVIYEGLPHQMWEGDLLASELKYKKTVTLHEFPFYEETISIEMKDAEKLTKVCSESKTYDKYTGEKLCGGFHPDWCLEFKVGNDAYQLLVCLGCHEARIYGPKTEVLSDFENVNLNEIKELLEPLHKNRPKRPKKTTEPKSEKDPGRSIQSRRTANRFK